MANTAGMGATAKQAALAAVVNGVALKAALYLSSATTGPTNTAYTATGELAATGGYSAGGVSVTNANSAGLTSTTTFWTPSATISFGTITSSGTFNAAMIYDTGQSNRNLGVFTFGDQTVTAGAFSLTMPTNDSSTGLLRIN